MRFWIDTPALCLVRASHQPARWVGWHGWCLPRLVLLLPQPRPFSTKSKSTAADQIPCALHMIDWFSIFRRPNVRVLKCRISVIVFVFYLKVSRHLRILSPFNPHRVFLKFPPKRRLANRWLPVFFIFFTSKVPLPFLSLFYHSDPRAVYSLLYVIPPTQTLPQPADPPPRFCFAAYREKIWVTARTFI